MHPPALAPAPGPAVARAGVLSASFSLPAAEGSTAAAVLEDILLTAHAGDAIISVDSVWAIAGRGLEGDRYFLGTDRFSAGERVAAAAQRPRGEVTLIEAEAIEAFAGESGLPFTARLARRNLVTRGVRLNDLVGRVFRVGGPGGVRLRGWELCEPCTGLARQSWPAVLPGLVHRGGLRAQILDDGELRVGDAVITAG